MKKILLDEGVPRPLARKLRASGLDVSPFPNDWKQLSNGALLDRIVVEGFDVLITNDKNMRHQQALENRSLAVVDLPTNRLPDVLAMAPQIVLALSHVKAGRFTNVDATAHEEA